ncbi:LacI family DNA-binding transcriptional regulator (plasmid) [Streptomyces sp. AHU1]|uniref:LacI family DNA-binding transcriptional regulator n=1 Tax=Streptomyces sp. AHU1 TaxID=3377215 RepID=UPI003877DE1D
MKEVAKLAGTSWTVVSYVVNDGPRPVAPETRKRVLEAMKTLGYRKNALAQALKTQQTSTLGIVLPDLARPFFSEMARAIEDAAYKRDLRVLVGSSHFDHARQAAYVDTYLQLQVEGILLVPIDHQVPEGLRHAFETGMPVTSVHRKIDLNIPAVVADDAAGGRLAAEHLLSKGHSRIACLSGPREDEGPIETRTRGFLDALAAEGAPQWIPPVRCSDRDLRQQAYEQASRLLTEHPDVTAICAVTDELALGVMRASFERGRRIGTDLSLISIDGTEQTQLTAPPLTVVQEDFAMLGELAVRLLLGQEPSAASTEENASHVVPMNLVPRRSVHQL